MQTEEKVDGELWQLREELRAAARAVILSGKGRKDFERLVTAMADPRSALGNSWKCDE